MEFIIHTDGGARGNPGPAAVGVVIERLADPHKKPEEVSAFGKYIGETTNNVAEYQGVVEALIAVKKLGSGNTLHFYLDSTLVVNQINGLFKVKDARLRQLLMSVRLLEQELGGKITYASVPREQNSRADFFVNQALDAKLL